MYKRENPKVLIIGILIIMFLSEGCSRYQPIPEKVTFQTTMMNHLLPKYRVDTAYTDGISFLNNKSSKQLILQTKKFGRKKFILEESTFNKKYKKLSVSAHSKEEHSYRVIFEFKGPFNWWKVGNECTIFLYNNDRYKNSSGAFFPGTITSISGD